MLDTGGTLLTTGAMLFADDMPFREDMPEMPFTDAMPLTDGAVMPMLLTGLLTVLTFTTGVTVTTVLGTVREKLCLSLFTGCAFRVFRPEATLLLIPDGTPLWSPEGRLTETPSLPTGSENDGAAVLAQEFRLQETRLAGSGLLEGKRLPLPGINTGPGSL